METGTHLGYFRLLVSVATPNLLHPLGAVRTIRAIIESGDFTPMLHTMNAEGMPTMVVHAANPNPAGSTAVAVTRRGD